MNVIEKTKKQKAERLKLMKGMKIFLKKRKTKKTKTKHQYAREEYRSSSEK